MDIDSFDSKNYQVSNGKGNYNYFPISEQDKMHLWTISDAKCGDVVCYKDEISLYKHDIKNYTKREQTFGGFVYHCGYDGKRFITDSLYSLTEQDKMNIHPATKEHCDLLFQKIKEAGYKWNTGTKTLEELIELKFKIGDRVKSIPTGKIYIIDRINENGYFFKNEGGVGFTYENDCLYELLPNKFDINTLKPYDKVLVRLTRDGVWHATFFSHYDKEVNWGCYPFVTTSSKSYSMCIPYKGNEHLTGKKDDCDEFYKTWE